MWRFDPHVPLWTNIPARGALPSIRSRHAMACSERYLYRFGGANGPGSGNEPVIDSIVHIAIAELSLKVCKQVSWVISGATTRQCLSGRCSALIRQQRLGQDMLTA